MIISNKCKHKGTEHECSRDLHVPCPTWVTTDFDQSTCSLFESIETHQGYVILGDNKKEKI